MTKFFLHLARQGVPMKFLLLGRHTPRWWFQAGTEAHLLNRVLGAIPHPHSALEFGLSPKGIQQYEEAYSSAMTFLLRREFKCSDLSTFFRARCKNPQHLWDDAAKLCTQLNINPVIPVGVIPPDQLAEIMRALDDGGDKQELRTKLLKAHKDACRKGGKAGWERQIDGSAAAGLPKALPLHVLGSEALAEATAGPPASQRDIDKVATAFQEKCRDGGRNNPNAWINETQFERLLQVRFLLTFPPKLYTNTRLALPRSVFLIGACLAK